MKLLLLVVFMVRGTGSQTDFDDSHADYIGVIADEVMVYISSYSFTMLCT